MKGLPIIVGAGEAERTPRSGKVALDLAIESIHAALADARLDANAIDCIFSGYTLSEHHLDFSALIVEQLGINPNAAGTISRSGATGVALVGMAMSALRSGACRTALVVWADNRESSSREGIVQQLAGLFTPYELPFGPLVATQYALIESAYVKRHQVTPEQLASVAVSFREHAGRNAKAKYRKPITIADVLSSPMISTPLRRLECTLVTDFGGALVLTTRDRARDFSKPIGILGYGEATTHDSILTLPQLFEDPAIAIRAAGTRAFKMAGILPSEVGMAQLYDCFTPTVLIELEGLGLVEPGSAGERVADGLLDVSGGLPTNTNGGMLSCANGGILHVTEAIAQLRGTAGDHQLNRIPDVALVHGNGGILACQATLIVERL